MLAMGMGFPNLVENESPDDTLFSCQRQQACGKSPAAPPKAVQPRQGSCRTSAGSAGKNLTGAETESLPQIQRTKSPMHDRVSFPYADH